jgi:hypothetical protein
MLTDADIAGSTRRPTEYPGAKKREMYSLNTLKALGFATASGEHTKKV